MLRPPLRQRPHFRQRPSFRWRTPFTTAQDRRFARFQLLAEGLQVDHHVGGALVASVGVLGEALVHQQFQLHRDTGPQCRHRLGLFAGDRIHYRLIVVALERLLAGDHLVQNDSQGPDVGAAIDLAAVSLLGRHVGDRAHRLVQTCKF